MSLRKRTKVVSLSIGLLALISVAGWLYAQRGSDSVAPEKLLPARSIIYVKANGSLLTDEAFKKTASYKALYESGMMQMIEDAFASLPNETPYADKIEEALEHIEESGISLAITDGMGMQPWGIIVVHDAIGGSEFLSEMLEMLPPGVPEFQQVERDGREITMTMIPNAPVELGFWEEQGHLVIAVGMEAIRSAIAVADGDQPNLTSSPLYEEYIAGDSDFTVKSIGWFDFGSLVEMYGEFPVPIPSQQGVTAKQVLAAVGLDTLGHVVALSGYHGEAIWTEQIVTVTGETTGLMDLMMQKPMTFADLPPIPVGQSSLFAASFDWEKADETVWSTLETIAEYAPPGAMDQVNEAVAQIEQVLGFTPPEFFSTIGNVHCIYADQYQGMFGLGGAIVVSVKDADRLRGLLNNVFRIIERESRGEFLARDIEKQGRTVTLFRFEDASYFTPAICVDDEWVIIGLVPQAVEACLMRLDGKLPSWEPTGEYAESLAELPKEFTSISIIDPRDTYRFLFGFAPMLIGGAEMAIRESRAFPEDFEIPFTPADFPPTEVITAPLFPNVMMSTVDENGVHSYARQSLPGIPLLGGSGGGTAIATSAVLVALLLPAVQQAREAARRTQSKNNLKQIMLAMHNYHDVYNKFPQGTVPNEDLEPEERLSWLVSILPYMDQAQLYDQVDMKAGWESEENSDWFEAVIPTYNHPSEPVNRVDGYGATHYLGMAGVGAKGPTLEANDPKAGVFAYNRATHIRDIHDGTSNTIAIGETTDPGPYAAGGKSTIRPLDKQPYINGGNGYGSKSVGGAQFGFADGSVHFISENVDPEVMEALSTIRGGEVIGQF